LQNKKVIPGRQRNCETSSFAEIALPFSAIVGQEQMGAQYLSLPQGNAGHVSI